MAQHQDLCALSAMTARQELVTECRDRDASILSCRPVRGRGGCTVPTAAARRGKPCARWSPRGAGRRVPWRPAGLRRGLGGPGSCAPGGRRSCPPCWGRCRLRRSTRWPVHGGSRPAAGPPPGTADPAHPPTSAPATSRPSAFAVALAARNMAPAVRIPFGRPRRRAAGRG